MTVNVQVQLDGKLFEFNQRQITDLFHVMYYGSRVWEHTKWFGHQILKCPMDMWIYQELIWKIRPDYIIETGTFQGGSALYYSHLFDLIGHGEVITIDIKRRESQAQHARINYLVGSSTDPEILKQVKDIVGDDKKIMVVLDSDHSYNHVLNEMRIWKDMVNIGSYMIVEDSNINGHPARPDFGPGPMEAINEFMSDTSQFAIDLDQEKFFMTQNPRGYLLRIS
jgi:cephalosporin hydroxylase